MNDVKITEDPSGVVWLSRPFGPATMLLPDDLAALEAHYRAKFAAEQPATPTPSTEQIEKAAEQWAEHEAHPNADPVNTAQWGFEAGVRWLAALVSPVSEQPHPLDAPMADAGLVRAPAPEGRVRYVRPPEQPTPLDPSPYRCGALWRAEIPRCDRPGWTHVFEPRPGFEQDRARYEQGGDR